MKKFKRLKFCILAALLIVPALLLTACDDPNYYNIFVGYSGPGTASGASPTRQYAEGTSLTLTANENDGAEFLCWIKDFSYIVSKDKEYTFTVNGDTAGKYIAQFGEPVSSMQFVSLTDVQMTLPGVSSGNAVNLSVTIVPQSSTSETAQTNIYSSSVTLADNPTRIFNDRVFSFLDEEEFYINVAITYVLPNTTGEETTIEIHFDGENSLRLSHQEINANGGKITLQGKDTRSNGEIQLSFQKIDYNLINGL